jgi:long-chain acyl-CoA synthetase
MTSGKEGVSWEKGDTWPKVLQHNYETYGDTGTALRFKHYGIWQPCTWKDYYLNVKTLALGLLSLGFESGDKVLIVGDNAPQWVYAELAAQANLGVSVGGYSDLMPREITTLAEHCEARFAIVEDQEQVDKFLQIKDELPSLKKIIYWNPKGLAHYKDPLLMGFRQVLTLGETYEKEHPGLFEKNIESGQADDVCALVYTSGTTGTDPKAAVHTFRTMREGVESILNLDPWDEKDNLVPYRPPAWMTEQYCLIGCHLLSGCVLNFAEEPETLQRDIQETKPSIVFYSARRWESQAAKVQARMQGIDALKKLAFAWLMPIGTKMADLKFQKKKPGGLLRLLYALADIILFGPIRSSLGLSNVRICYSTEALLSPDALRFYHALNLSLKSLYGTTEGGILTGAGNEDIHPETVGPVLQGGEVKITDQGEIAYRQPGIFIGYYKDPEKTAEVLKNGWFYSGDSGFIREDGHLVFVDRSLDLVALTRGEKLAPQGIESRLNFSPYIQESWVLAGPNRAYVSAIIVIHYSHVSQWAGQRKIAFNTFAELSQNPEVHALVKQDIDRVNRTLSPGSRIKKYVHLHREFDPDEGEITRTRNLRRTVLEGHYRQLIEAIYGDLNEAPIEARVKYQDGRTGTKKIILTIQKVEGAAS